MSTPPARAIRIEPFSAANADLVLKWRNAPHVRANSLDSRVITQSDHKEFLERISLNDEQNFFLVYFGDQPQAVLNINRIDVTEGNWGCYLGEGNIRPGLFPMLILIAGHLAFNRYQLGVLRSDVLSENEAPQKMNQFLGIECTGIRQQTRSNRELITVFEYVLLRENWHSVKKRASKLLTRDQRALVASFETPAS